MVSGGASRICIIGGGAAGLAILKVLLEAEEYKAGLWELVAYEAREQLGGVWSPSPPNGDPPASPLYDSLSTNLPHPLMAFKSYWYPPGTPLFPRASVVLQYLQDYAKEFGLRKFINFNTGVEEVLWKNQSWRVRLSNNSIRQFDKIVVATGHYHLPHYPAISGLNRWVESGRALHSVYYRNVQPYRNTRVLVIGGGPSGQDIAAEVSTVATTVYHSVHLAVFEDVGNAERSNVIRKGEVIRFGEAGMVAFEDDSAFMIDLAIIATGYIMSFPFLPQLRQEQMPKIPPIPSHVLNSTYNVFPLARHMFPVQDDFPMESIAFVGLLSRVVPFPLFENQGRLISKVFSQPGYLDRLEEIGVIIARYDHLQGRWGDKPNAIAKNWHVFEGRQPFSYRRELLDLAKGKAEWYPEDWSEEIYLAKFQLRSAWVKLERNGKADEWVRGVGEGGRHEWVSMMKRLLDTTTNAN